MNASRKFRLGRATIQGLCFVAILALLGIEVAAIRHGDAAVVIAEKALEATATAVAFLGFRFLNRLHEQIHDTTPVELLDEPTPCLTVAEMRHTAIDDVKLAIAAGYVFGSIFGLGVMAGFWH